MKYAIATIVVLLLAILSVVAWREYTTAKRRSAELAEQKMCSIQAAKVDAEQPHGAMGHGYLGHGALAHGYSSHYNPATNACYVMFYDEYPIGLDALYNTFTTGVGNSDQSRVNHSGKNSYSKSLYIEDAFDEGRRYGKYSEVPAGSTCECTFSPPARLRLP